MLLHYPVCIKMKSGLFDILEILHSPKYKQYWIFTKNSLYSNKAMQSNDLKIISGLISVSLQANCLIKAKDFLI